MRKARLWGSMGAFLALALCFSALRAAPGGDAARLPQPLAQAERAASLSGGAAVEAFRRQRSQTREDQFLQLESLAQSEKLGESARAQMEKMLEREMQETNVEGILAARGFGGALCVVGERDVFVLTKEKSLTASQLALILDTVTGQTGRAAGRVKIIPAG